MTTGYQYQLLPELSGNEYTALKDDIARRGVMVSVEYDEEGNVLDGHHRIRACQELGITDWPRVIRSGLSEDAKTEHILALNLDRRHLSREQRRELVVKLRGQGWSYPRIADKVGVSVGTAYGDSQVFKNENLPDTVVGKDGKQYPAYHEDTMSDYEWNREQILEANRQGACIIVPPEEPEEQPPHVSHNSGDNEWYTPQEYIDAAREVLGEIDLDPASTETANSIVGATKIFTEEDNGLLQGWGGRVWMNPPYASPLIRAFCAKLAAHYEQDDVTEAIVLVNNATETQWFNLLISVASAVCFPQGRVKFWAVDKEAATPLQGQAVIYIGRKPLAFKAAFAHLGWIASL